jgi:hypothetical protein
MRRMYAERAAPRANELRAFYVIGRMSATGEAKGVRRARRRAVIARARHQSASPPIP